MCGRCRHVFNSFESLQRIDSTLGEAPVQPPRAQPAAEREYTAEAPMLMESPPVRSEYPPPAIDLGGTPSVPAFLDASQPARAPEANTLSPYRNAPLLPKEASTPPRQLRWTVLTAIAALTLAAQVGFMWRSEIVSQYPVTRPFFESACQHLGCVIPWGRDAAALKVESSDLIEELGAKGRFLLTATIANRAAVVQDYPHIELSLTDTNNQTLARRVLPPEAYLSSAALRAEGMAPGASTPINVRVDSQLVNAAGYNIELFFP